MEQRNLPPGPTQWPCLGTFPNIATFGADKLHRYYMDLQRRYGDLAQIKFGKYPALIVSGSDVVTDVFLHQPELELGKPTFLPAVQNMNFTETGIVYTTGETHKKTKNAAMSGLEGVVTSKGYGEHLIREMDAVVKKFANLDGAEFQPAEALLSASMSLNMYAAFGKSYSNDDPGFKKCFKFARDMINNPGSYSPGGTLPAPLKSLPCFNNGHGTYIAAVNGLAESLLPELHTLKENNQGETETVAGALIKADMDNPESQLFSDESIARTIVQCLIGGVSSIPYTVDWALLYMAAHPDMQQRCYQEIQGVCRSHGVEYQHLPDLPYICAVVKEIQRLCTIIPTSIPSSVLKDTKINGYDIPKDTLIASNITSVHMDPAHWTDPEQFNPERFLANAGSLAENPPSFMPFGTGERQCVGYLFAEKTITLMFANLIQSLDFTNNGKVNFEGKFTQNVHPASNILKAKKRNGN